MRRLRSSKTISIAATLITIVLPGALPAQSPRTQQPTDAVMTQFEYRADDFGWQLVEAFDSIPAARYDYRPTPVQQSVGYIAQHLEDANYGLCERFGELKHRETAKDSLADTVKARWPKDTLVKRLYASLRFCDLAIEGAGHLQSAALASNLLLFETDLAEHYSQLSSYMRLLGMVPPSALPPKKHTATELPASELSRYPGVYQLVPGLELDVTMQDDALFVRSNVSARSLRLWPERTNNFFVNEADAQITFTRDATDAVTGLILHQFGRDRVATKVR